MEIEARVQYMLSSAADTHGRTVAHDPVAVGLVRRVPAGLAGLRVAVQVERVRVLVLQLRRDVQQHASLGTGFGQQAGAVQDRYRIRWRKRALAVGPAQSFDAEIQRAQRQIGIGRIDTLTHGGIDQRRAEVGVVVDLEAIPADALHRLPPEGRPVERTLRCRWRDCAGRAQPGCW